MTQQYSLRWNNHQPNFISEFASLLDTKTLVDVTLAAEGRHILAHKLVLSACSTYFHSLFVDNPSNHPIVILKDVTFANLRTMVDFIYRGEVNVAEDQLEKVLETAKTLKIKGLTEMPETTSVMRSQAVEYQHQHQPQPQAQPPSEPEHQPQPSPGLSPTNKRRRIASPSVEQVREPASLSSLPQRRHIDDTHETQQLNMDTMSINTSGNSLQGGQWLEQSYQRYQTPCVAGDLQDSSLYMSSLSNPNMEQALDFAQSMGAPGPSPGPSCAPEPPTQEQPTLLTTKRRRATNPQGEENFQRALEAVRLGGIGFCKAARMFGVNNRTLWLEYKKRGYPNTRPSIRNRIKREQPTPPPKQDMVPLDQQMALICPPHPVPVGFIDSRQIDFPIHGVPQNSPLNILGVNFNSMQ